MPGFLSHSFAARHQLVSQIFQPNHQLRIRLLVLPRDDPEYLAVRLLADIVAFEDGRGHLWLDLHDLLFLVKCLQDPDDNIEINRFITFRRTCTRAGSTGRMLTIKLVHTSAARHFYFNRIAMLWNVVQSSTNLSVTESLSTVKRRLIIFLWAHFNSRFDPLNSCTYHIVCPCSNCHFAARF